jgi:hypothetical protein
MNFDGSSQLIDLGRPDELNLMPSVDEFSIFAWFKTSAQGTIYSFGAPSSNSNTQIKIAIRGGDYLPEVVLKGTATTIGSTTYNDGNWHNIVLTCTTSTANLYIDGSNVGSPTIGTATITSTDNGAIGARTAPTGGFFFNGQIDAVSIFNYALTDGTGGTVNQIATLYGSSSTGIGNPMSLSPAPVSYYPLGDQDAFNGAEYLVPNSSLKDYVFDFGGSDTINLGNDSSLRITAEMTVSCWIKITDSGQNIIVGRERSSTGRDWKLYLSNGIIFFWCSANGTASDITVLSSSSAFNDGNWHNLTAINNGTNQYIYIDGVLNNSNSGGQTINASTADNYIGSRNGTSFFFNGELSNVQIFNTALPATGSNSVETLYNNGSPLTSMSGFTSLQGWWKLDASATYDGSDWTIPDDSSNSNDGTSSGMTQSALQQSDLSFKTSYSPYALGFDGANDIIDCGSDSSLTPTTAFSVSCWVYLNATGTQTILHNGSGFSDGYFLYFTGSGLTFYIREGNSPWRSLNSNDSFIANTWYNVTATWGGSTMKMYINNILQSNTATAASINISTRFRIGAYNGTAILNGRLSNVSVWNAALTQAQVSEIYAEGIPQNLNNHSAYSNLVSWWQLGSNTSWVDPYWIALDEKGTNNGESQNVAAPNNMGENAIVDGVGSYANGLSSGMSDNIVGSAPFSDSNSLSYNMDVLDRTEDTPS